MNKNDVIEFIGIILTIVGFSAGLCFAKIAVILLAIIRGFINPFYILPGFAIGLIVMVIIYGNESRDIIEIILLFKSRKGKDCLNQIVNAAFEEVVWRDFIVAYAISHAGGTTERVIVMVISSFLFVLMHEARDKYSYVEMWIFTMALCFVALFFPGANHGLHIARNLMISKREDKASVDNQYKVEELNEEKYIALLDFAEWFTPIQSNDFKNAFIVYKNETPILGIIYSDREKLAYLGITVYKQDVDAFDYSIRLIKEKSSQIRFLYTYIIDEYDEVFLQSKMVRFRKTGRMKKGIRIENKTYGLSVFCADIEK